MSVRIIAYYLPQFHPIPENDEWWGKGFTEWTNVKKAKPLYHGHVQPRIPTDLGYYDLRDPEARSAQADLAKEYGIEGFCYWHYWLGNGQRLLERPFEEVLSSGQPDFPFCLGWANHSWAGVWFGAPKKMLMAQTYPGQEDYKQHFQYLLRAFNDPRYITVDGKPLFLVFRSREIPNVKKVMEFWRGLALKAGLKGLHLVAHDLAPSEALKFGFDATTYANHRIVANKFPKYRLLRMLNNIYHHISGKPLVFKYKNAMPFLNRYDSEGNVPMNDYPAIVPNWDSTPRLGNKGLVLHDANPELFKLHLAKCLNDVLYKPPEKRIVFLKSWNEWAEGNYVEPDQLYGHGYLQAIKEALTAIK